MSVPNFSDQSHQAHEFGRDELRAINHHHSLEIGEKDPEFGTNLAQAAHFSLFPLGKISDTKWVRKNPYGAVAIQAGLIPLPGGQDFKQANVPHGGLPRLLMAHITTEARRIHQAGGDPSRLDLTESLNAMVRQLGLKKGSRNNAVMRALEDTLSARVTFSRIEEAERNGQKGHWQHTIFVPQIASSLSLWLPYQEPLEGFEPYVTLTPQFLEQILNDKAVVPVRMDLLAQLAGKPMAFDLLLWLQNVTYSLHRGNQFERFFSWQYLFDTTTHEYTQLNDFATRWKRALTETRRYYPDAQVELVRGSRAKPGGIIVKRSPLLVAPKRGSITA